MDFVSDQLYDGCKLRALTLVDVHTRECLAIWVDQGIRGDDVVRTLGSVVALRGQSERIQIDNGPEFVSKALDRWAYEHGVELAFSRPGKPTDNAHIEAFNGRLRQECLNQHWFLSLSDAREKVEVWRRGYNETRAHDSLGWATPAECARQCLARQALKATKEPEPLPQNGPKTGEGSETDSTNVRLVRPTGGRSTVGAKESQLVPPAGRPYALKQNDN
jgi:putative transposase